MSEQGSEFPKEKNTPDPDARIVGGFYISGPEAFFISGGKTRDDNWILEARKRMRSSLTDDEGEYKNKIINYAIVFRDPDGRITASISSGWGPDAETYNTNTTVSHFIDLNPDTSKLFEDFAKQQNNGEQLLEKNTPKDNQNWMQSLKNKLRSLVKK